MEKLINEAPRHRAEIRMKYSAWTADVETFRQYAPRTLEMLKDGIDEGEFEETGETLWISSFPHHRKSPVASMEVMFTPLQDVLSVRVEVTDFEPDSEYDPEDPEPTTVVRFLEFKYVDNHSLNSVLESIDEVEAEFLRRVEC